MDFKQVIQELYSINTIKLGLDRITRFLFEFGNPHTKLKFIHVAGTNGKGSVSSMIASVLKESGYTVGLYTSPHLVNFVERIKVNDVEIKEEDVISYYHKIKEKDSDLTFFEVVTIIAFLYFLDKKCDYVVLEVGMGGRLDATNVVTPIVSVITNISIEHKKYLGDTIAKVTREKAGIIKVDVPVVTHCIGEALDVVREIASNKNALVIEAKHYDFKTNLQGDFQKNNSDTAVTTLKNIDVEINDDMISKGLMKVNWPGRLDVRKNVIFDCCHNPAAAQVLANELEQLEFDNLYIILGMSNDKDHKNVISILEKYASKMIFTNANHERALSASDLALFSSVEHLVISNVHDALKIAKNLASKNDLILITGSIFLVGELIT